MQPCKVLKKKKLPNELCVLPVHTQSTQVEDGDAD